MKALVLGGTGFIGSFLAESLVRLGADVTCLVRKTSNLRYLDHLPIKKAYGSVEDPESLAQVVGDHEYIFHLAGLIKARSDEEFARVNGKGTRNLAEACKKNKKLKRLIYVSSIAAAGPSRGTPLREEETPMPISAYGRSKLEGERALWEEGKDIPSTIVRPPAVYGPRDEGIFTFFKILSLGIRPVLLGGERYFSFIYVDDLISGILRAAEHHAKHHNLYYFAEKQAYSWTEIMATFAGALAKKTFPIPIPLSLLKSSSHVSLMLSRFLKKPSVFNPDKVKEISERYWICSTSKAERELDFQCRTPLQEGAIKAVQWYRQIGWL